MIERRRFFRFTKEHSGTYRLSGVSEKRQVCSVIDFSRNGMKIFFQEKIIPGSLCRFDIPIPEEGTTINVKGTLQWAVESENGFIGGIALVEAFDDDNFRKIFTGYTISGETNSSECPAEIQVYRNSGFPFTKTVLPLKKAFCVLCLLIVLLSLPLLFRVVRGYSSGKSFNHNQHEKDTVLQPKKVPPVTLESASVISDQPTAVADEGIADEAVAAVSSITRPHIALLKEAGGSFYSLALKHYQRADETLFDLILQANPAITNVRKIGDEQQITLPVISSESYLHKGGGGDYRVYIGTFETFDLATAYSKKVTDSEKVFFIEPHQFSSQDTWYRLSMGDFNNRKDALGAVNLLEEADLIYISPDLK